jgi:hypothetical protein
MRLLAHTQEGGYSSGGSAGDRDDDMMTSWQSQQVSVKPTIRPRGAARNAAPAAAAGSGSGAAAANSQHMFVKPELTSQVPLLLLTMYSVVLFKLYELGACTFQHMLAIVV